MYRPPTRRRSSRRRWTALALLVLGLWIAVAPFTRPLPGGTHFSFESTPEVGCRTPLVGAFVEDRPTTDTYSTPRPQAGDPMVPTTVDCGGRAAFRLLLGTILIIMAVGLHVMDRRRGR